MAAQPPIITTPSPSLSPVLPGVSPPAGGRLFLGLDASTQGLKATAVDESLGVVHRFAINYQADLAGYGTTNGVVAKPGSVVVQPTLMVRADGVCGGKAHNPHALPVVLS
jgi:hypothetical protein